MKGDESLRAIPLVMLTTSGDSVEIAASYAAGANGFVTKPVSFAEFVECVRTIQLYWVLTNVAPDG